MGEPACAVAKEFLQAVAAEANDPNRSIAEVARTDSQRFRKGELLRHAFIRSALT
ncbi:hypothetical protein [Paraburkholderia tropica]|uniref:hypothetical protein n=1 Tax=Paraburkholderia tropica TaxID=92647 RepID=UPI001F4255E2|nr:hypothetical protein [Paraburkholderia tropica]